MQEMELEDCDLCAVQLSALGHPAYVNRAASKSAQILKVARWQASKLSNGKLEYAEMLCRHHIERIDNSVRASLSSATRWQATHWEVR